MKNIVTLIVVVVCLGLIYVGLTKNPPSSEPLEVVSNQSATEVKSEIEKSTTSQNLASIPSSKPIIVIGSTTPIKQEMKKYYPESSPVAGAGSSATVSAEQNFQITPSLLAKMHLVDKYKPGICFGAPATPPQSAIDSMKVADESLWQFVKGHYQLSTDLEIYNKIKQLQGAFLTETASGIFNFRFMDGQCQTVRYYEGIVKVIGTVVTETVTSQADHTY